MSEPFDAVALAAQIAAGFGLAACAGLRAFLPPLAVAVAARAGLMTLPEPIAWLSGTPSLVVLAAAVLFELAADKIPVMDHALDVAGTFLRPVAGAFVGAAPLLSTVFPSLGEAAGAGPAGIGAAGEGALDSSVAWALLLAGAGGGALVSAGVHAAKAGLRLAGTALTGGLANPIVSIAEDVASVLGVILSVLLPLLALVAVAGGMAAALFVARRAAAGGLRH